MLRCLQIFYTAILNLHYPGDQELNPNLLALDLVSNRDIRICHLLSFGAQMMSSGALKEV